jgi:hypothetical protein
MAATTADEGYEGGLAWSYGILGASDLVRT